MSHWRCITCGKWSVAHRRPLRHIRSDVVDGDYGEIVRQVVCGPFQEYTVTATENIGPRLPEHGTTVQEWAREEDPNAGIEVPF